MFTNRATVQVDLELGAFPDAPTPSSSSELILFRIGPLMLGLEYDPMQLTQLISVLMVAGLIAGFVAGLFGIGGGFVVVPALLLVFSFSA